MHDYSAVMLGDLHASGAEYFVRCRQHPVERSLYHDRHVSPHKAHTMVSRGNRRYAFSSNIVRGSGCTSTINNAVVTTSWPTPPSAATPSSTWRLKKLRISFPGELYVVGFTQCRHTPHKTFRATQIYFNS